MKRLFLALGVVVAASVLLEILFSHEVHAELPWHLLPAFYFLFGLAGSLCLVLLSKGLVARLLQRSEDYYGNRK